MKTLIACLIFAASSVATANVNCVDVRVAMKNGFFAPCPEGTKLVHVQGRCVKSFETESSYCAQIDEPVCEDGRLFKLPCPKGQEREFVRGRCTKVYQYEHSYCRIKF